MPKYQVPLSRLSQLEQAYADFTERTYSLLEKIRPMRAMLRHLRVDIDKHNRTDPAWLREFDTTCEEAWEACRTAHQHVLDIRAELEKGPPEMVGPIIDVVKAARELVQADNACILGRSGCEQRWDKAMDELKQAITKVKD